MYIYRRKMAFGKVLGSVGHTTNYRPSKLDIRSGMIVNKQNIERNSTSGKFTQIDNNNNHNIPYIYIVHVCVI